MTPKIILVSKIPGLMFKAVDFFIVFNEFNIYENQKVKKFFVYLGFDYFQSQIQHKGFFFWFLSNFKVCLDLQSKERY